MPQTEMRALAFEGPAADTSRTRVLKLPVPDPAEGQVLIEVAYSGVNFKDVMVRRGDPGYAPSWPVVPGLEVAGTVRAVGHGVSGFSVGDVVAALTNAGGLAEFAVADSALTAKVPAGVPLSVAAVAPGVLTTAELLLSTFARVRAGDVIVVHSAGGAVGEAVAALSRSLAMVTLVGVTGSRERAAAALRSGYDASFVRTDGLADAVRSHLDGRGADVILDPQGTEWLSEDLELIAPGGRIVLFGNAGGDELSPLPAAGVLFGKNAAVGGFSLAALSKSQPAEIGAALRRVLAQLANGTVSPQVSVVRGLDAAAEPQQLLAEGKGVGKYVIEVAG